LDHVFIFHERHLQRVLAEYVGYFISTTGARIDRWDNGRLVRRCHARLIETPKLERSSPCLCWGAFITCIGKPHDDVPDLILAPYRLMHLSKDHPDSVTS